MRIVTHGYDLAGCAASLVWPALIIGIVGMIDREAHVRLSADLFLDGTRQRV